MQGTGRPARSLRLSSRRLPEEAPKVRARLPARKELCGHTSESPTPEGNRRLRLRAAASVVHACAARRPAAAPKTAVHIRPWAARSEADRLGPPPHNKMPIERATARPRREQSDPFEDRKKA